MSDSFGGTDQFDDVGTTSAGVIQIGRTSYAYGLEWGAIPADKASKGKGRAEIRRIAQEQQSDLVCYVGNSSYGLTNRSLGHSPGQKPLATAVAYSLMDPFLAAFHIDGVGYYVVASREGHILPGCERMFDNSLDASAFFRDLMTKAAWSTPMQAPAEWGLSNTEESSLVDLVSTAKSRVKIVDATRKALYLRLALGALAVALVGGGYYGWHVWSEERQQEKIALQRAAAARREAQSKALAAAEAARRVWPYDDKAVGVYAINDCVKLMRGLRFSVPGWTAKEMKCKVSEHAIYVSYERTYGTINWLKPWLDRTYPHDETNVVVDNKSLKAAGVKFNIPAFGHLYPHHSDTLAMTDVQAYLTKQFDEVGQEVKMTRHEAVFEKKRNGPVQRMQGKSQEPEMSFGHIDFSWTADVNPTDFLPLLAPLKAFVVDYVSVDLSSLKWSVAGSVYERVVKNPSATKTGMMRMPVIQPPRR